MGRTKHTDAPSFAALANYSVPHIVGLGSALGKTAVAGLIAVLSDEVLTADLQPHDYTLHGGSCTVRLSVSGMLSAACLERRMR